MANLTNDEIDALVASGQLSPEFADELRTMTMPRSFPPSQQRPQAPLPVYPASGARLPDQLAARVGATTGATGEPVAVSWAPSGKPKTAREEMAARTFQPSGAPIDDPEKLARMQAVESRATAQPIEHDELERKRLLAALIQTGGN